VVFSFALFTRAKKYMLVPMMLVIAVDLFYTNSGRIGLVDMEKLTEASPVIESLKLDKDTRYFRIWLSDDEFVGSRAKYFKLFCVNGDSPLALRKYEKYLEALTGLEKVRKDGDNTMENLVFARVEPFLNNILNVKYFGYKPPESGKTVFLENDHFFPRALFVTNSVQTSAESFLKQELDPRTTVSLHDAHPGWANSNDQSGPEAAVVIDSYSNDEIELSVDAPKNGFVVLSEVYYPGWKAEIDGQAAKVLCGNYMLRVIPVARGHHKIKVFYAPASIRIGIIVTAVTLVMAIMLLISKRKTLYQRD